jgi:hypothetical protein
MAKKFLTLVENNITRYNNGGILVGDVVLPIKNFKSHPAFKMLAPEVQKYAEDFFAMKKNIRITDIKTKYPTGAPNDEDNRGIAFYIELSHELAPGLYDQANKVTVPRELVYVNNSYSNLPPTDEYKHKEKRTRGVDITKDKYREEAEESPYNPYLQTLYTQDNSFKGTVRPTDTSLKNVNVTIKSNPDSRAKDPQVKGFSSVEKPLSKKMYN